MEMKKLGIWLEISLHMTFQMLQKNWESTTCICNAQNDGFEVNPSQLHKIFHKYIYFYIDYVKFSNKKTKAMH